jgi:putative ABC transport system permease protein
MSLVSGWRLALRLAWREAVRSRARSALVLVMVTFPVIAVIAADVSQSTSSVSSVEGLDRRIGSAQALVAALPMSAPVLQGADPDRGTMSHSGRSTPAPRLSDIEAALGQDRPAVELRSRQVGVRTDLGVLPVAATGVDLRSPLATGLYRLTSGRWPATVGEVAVNSALAAHGYAVGDRLALTGGTVRTIVGTAESTGVRTQPLLVGPLDSLPAPPRTDVRTWLLGGAPVTWHEVLAANQVGASVLSRAVVEHPPPSDQLPPQVRSMFSSDRSQIYAVLVLIAVMALLEVVLLAGPAFAVGARRQSRTLALIAANGGNPSQARRVVLASAVVLGSIGAVTGGVLGIVVARLILPLLQGMQDTWFGPFQIRWFHLAGIAGFGVLSAFLAAVVPAWVASRQDVVAVLAGRRGDRAASRRSPVIGLVLLGLGVVGAVLGSRGGSGEFLIAGAAVVSVFGMIFLVPIVVVTVARLGNLLPLTLRYAVRDAARHRTRTVPAVAAVAATVAGVVALSIANTSDQAQAKADYTALLPVGMSSLTVNGPSPGLPAVQGAVARIAPGAVQQVVQGLAPRRPVTVRVPRNLGQVGAYSSPLGSQLLVSDGGAADMPPLLSGWVSADAWARASRTLSHGGALVFSDGPVTTNRVRLARTGNSDVRLVVPAVFVDIGHAFAPAMAVIPTALAHRLGQVVQPRGLLLSGTPLSRSQESTLRETLGGLDPSSYLYVERGYQEDGATKIVLWILFGLGAVLMLGGTLTATFLALSDARPDLATLSAVGASPRTRRGVAAAYAVAVGFVGAVLGALVGFIPGIAVTYPLTRSYTGGGPSHYLVIPWLLIGALVLALPLLTAGVVGLAARSKLPLVARLD